MHRKLLVGSFGLNGRSLEAGVVHLESYRESTVVRAAQLAAIYRILAQGDHAILMGDFNFCASWQENDRLSCDYKDMWAVLRPGEPGFTENTYQNPMLYRKKSEHKTVRFDRILARSSRSGLTLDSIDLLGTRPVSAESQDVYTSDHFGLAGRFRLSGRPTEKG